MELYKLVRNNVKLAEFNFKNSFNYSKFIRKVNQILEKNEIHWLMNKNYYISKWH